MKNTVHEFRTAIKTSESAKKLAELMFAWDDDKSSRLDVYNVDSSGEIYLAALFEACGYESDALQELDSMTMCILFEHPHTEVQLANATRFVADMHESLFAFSLYESGSLKTIELATVEIAI
jgi:hypothetical protein